MVLYPEPLQDLLSYPGVTPRRMKEVAGNPRTSEWLFVVLCGREELSRSLSCKSAPQTVVCAVAGDRCRDAQSLFAEWSVALRFPDYFGHNWNALEECMNDLPDWLPAYRYVIVVKDADTLLSACPEAERRRLMAILLDILEKAAARYAEPIVGEWAREAVGFSVLMHSEVTRRHRLLDVLGGTRFHVCEVESLSQLLGA